MKLSWLNLTLVLFWTTCGASYNILGVFPFPGISHQILCIKLAKGLLKAGHDVTFVSPFPLKDIPKTSDGGKLTEIVIEELVTSFNSTLGSSNLFEVSLLQMMSRISTGMWENANITLHDAQLRKVLATQKFDAVIIEQTFNDALNVLSHVANCPLILLSSIGPNSLSNAAVGNPQPVAYAPHMFSKDFSKDLSFVNRAKNLFFFAVEVVLAKLFIFPMQERLIQEAYPDSPPFPHIQTNVSLVLLNSHTSLYPALPLVPNMVEIGGYFIDPPKKLPDDLREFLDGATEGAIYFSMGSNLKSKDLPAERKRIILNVLGKLKQKVLWKFEEELPGKPPNVMIRSWLPQQDILAHPNIKLFISHCGMLSSTETVYHGVPILAIPIYGDQPANADRAVASGYALKLDFHGPDFTEEKITQLIQTLLTDPKYRENVKRRSKVFHDRPMDPMKTAVFWVEYVIRHKGALHLRVAGVNQPWYEYLMVDVLAVVLLGFLLTIYGIKFAFKKLFCKAKRYGSKLKTN